MSNTKDFEDNPVHTFKEFHSKSSGLFFQYSKLLEHRQSKWQNILIFDTEDYGKVMIIDGLVMLTERDEYGYHEMIVHVPMLSHPDPKRVLIVGGGDGGSLREVLRHADVERVTQVEIDEDVVRLCREYFSWAEEAYVDPRVELIIGDAIEFVKSSRNEFDVIIIDSTDPVGPAEGIFTSEFHKNVAVALTEEGMVSGQIGSPFYSHSEIGERLREWRHIYKYATMFMTHVPTYPSGQWGIGLASKEYKIPREPEKVRYNTIKSQLLYYNRETHHASFMLPAYLRRAVSETG